MLRRSAEVGPVYTEKAIGDQAYPEFLVIDERRVLMAYYDGSAYEKGVPKRADIRLATLTLF